MRRRGREDGSGIVGTGEGLRGSSLGDDDGWLACRFVRVGDGEEEGASTVVVGGASKPVGTNARITSSRFPRDESESASERASPRRSSTS